MNQKQREFLLDRVKKIHQSESHAHNALRPHEPNMDKFIPVLFQEEAIGLVYFKNPVLNQFGGVDTNGIQVLKSAAGYYIGSLFEEGDTSQEPEEGRRDYYYSPYMRDSQEYWATREEAEQHLIKRDYQIKF